jgi:hypothetical protein
LFAATFFVTGTWFDVGRVDSLFLALSIGGLYAARRMTSTRGAIVAGVVLAAAALTKQTGLAEGVAVVAVLLTGPRARLGRVAALTEFAVFGISTLVLRLTSGGWYTYYVFKQMSEHSLTASNFGWFCSALLTAMGLAGFAAVIAARRVPRELLVGCAALAVEGCAALVHSGGTLNDVLPAYLAVALLAGLALGANSTRRGLFTRLGPFTRLSTVVSGVLVMAQSVLLLTSFHPSQAIPTSAARAAGQRLVAGMRAFGGDVVFPADPSLSLMAGMAPAAHPGAVYDVLRATDKGAIESFQRSADQAIATHRFSAFISNSPGEPLFNPPALTQDYHECVQPVPTLFVPAPGGHAVPAIIWIPWDGMSCQTAISILAGGKAARS